MANYNLTQTGAEVQELLNKVSLFGKFTCSDAADSQVKNIHIDDFTLIDGVAIAVTFVNGNSAASIQLNVNYTGNAPVYYRDSPLGDRLVTANATVILMYNATGNRWDVLSELCGTIGEAASRDVAREITDESSDEDIPTVGAVKGTMKNVVYDISAAHPDGQGNPTPYADLTAALGTGGVNIPEDIRKGGMSIKFIQGTVQSSDNKYVEYFLTKDEWSIFVGDWEKVNLEEEVNALDIKINGGKKYYANQEFNIQNAYINYTNLIVELSEAIESPFKYKFSVPIGSNISSYQIRVYEDDGTTHHQYYGGAINEEVNFSVTGYKVSKFAINNVSPDVRYTGTFGLEVYKIVSSEFENKIDKSSIVQETGTSDSDIMSQKATTDTINKLIDKIIDESSEWVIGKYIRYADGTEGGSASYSSTPFMDVPSASTLIVATNNNSNIVGVAFYDINKVYVSGESLIYDVANKVKEFSIEVPNSAAYFRYTCVSAYTSISYAYVQNGLDRSVCNLQKSILQSVTRWSFAMDNILCIGDSLTSGAYYDGSTFNGASVAQNYPYYLSRILNTQVTNAGVSGISVKGWYDNESDNYAYTDYNTVIIWLGSNNGLLKDLPENPNEGQINAHNNFVAYGQLIEKIQTANPNAQIVLCKIYFTNYWVDISNNGIQYYADLYSLPVIDLSDLNAENHPELRYVSANRYHLIKCGNITVANRIVQGFAEWISGNPQRCEFGLSLRAESVYGPN